MTLTETRPETDTDTVVEAGTYFHRAEDLRVKLTSESLHNLSRHDLNPALTKLADARTRLRRTIAVN